MTKSNRIEILGVPVDPVTQSDAMKIFRQLMGEPGCSLIVTPNSEIVLNASKDPALKKLISSAALILPDGIGLVYASRIIGKPLLERVTGVDFLTGILEELEATGQSIFLLGSKPASEERPSVAQLAGEAMKKAYPDLKIAGSRDGYFKIEEEKEIVRQINESGANFLCVALGSPKQEQFIARNASSFLSVRGAMGVGGSLDVWAGTVKRAPEFYQKFGLEWLFRFIQEPTRYKRMAQLPLFMLKVLTTPRK
jgi:N-acetylglucosaminyldiphosphoundecaprenol N-acetyl-beta-D-mannosaminyltransferase